MSQKELAHLMGYEQGYLSGLEIGRKGPPNEEFVGKLIDALNLDSEEQVRLHQAVQESQRRYSVPDDAPTEVFRLVHKLWRNMDGLYPVQIRMIEEVLSLQDEIGNMHAHPGLGGAMRNSQEQEAKM